MGIRPVPHAHTHTHTPTHAHAHAPTHTFTARLPLLPTDRTIDLHVYVDNVMVEVFFLGGRVALTSEIMTTKEAGFTLFTRGGDQGVVASEVNAWHMESAWVSPKDVRSAARLDGVKI